MTPSIHNKSLNHVTTYVTLPARRGAKEAKRAEIVKAVNSCTKTPLSAQAVNALVGRASSAAPAQSKIVKGGGLQRALLCTPETSFALMTRNKTKKDKKLGAGSFKTAKLAIDLKTGEKDVVAVCRRSKCSDEHWKSLEGEVAAMEALRGKEGIVQLYAHSKYNDRKHGEKMYLVMEYCDRGELFDTLVDKHHPIHGDFKQQLQIALDCARGLKVMHDNNLLHRDLKPENIFLFTGPDGKLHAKIGDLGFACGANDRDQLKTLCGTVLWFSPEKAALTAEALADNPVTEDEWIAVSTPKTDIWALGSIFHALFSPDASLTYCQNGSNNFHVSVNISYAIQGILSKGIQRVGMDPSVIPLVEQMLSVKPNERPTITEVCDYLEELAKSVGL